MFQVIKRIKIGGEKTFESIGFFVKKADAEQMSLEMIREFGLLHKDSKNGYLAKLPNSTVKIYWIEI